MWHMFSAFLPKCFSTPDRSVLFENSVEQTIIRRRSQPMKVIIHDLGDEVTCALKTSNEYSAVIHADNQYAPCRGCFKCWLKNSGFCIMKDSLQHMGALVGGVIL